MPEERIDPAEPHWRVAVDQSFKRRVVSVCVQDFDYDDCDFVTDKLFSTKDEAEKLAYKINARPWGVINVHETKAEALEEAADALEAENPLMDRATDVSGWLRKRAVKARWGLLG